LTSLVGAAKFPTDFGSERFEGQIKVPNTSQIHTLLPADRSAETEKMREVNFAIHPDLFGNSHD
jgi:hypothetical protein